MVYAYLCIDESPFVPYNVNATHTPTPSSTLQPPIVPLTSLKEFFGLSIRIRLRTSSLIKVKIDDMTKNINEEGRKKV